MNVAADKHFLAQEGASFQREPRHAHRSRQHEAMPSGIIFNTYKVAWPLKSG
jgi:hypothetical protein